ncbi:DegV family protein [Demequina globuliformis]|uniref:DegV family protein n=1 Tax=Demequina globuliformis TaxID=676202 RepID=UPI000784AEA8|nr:DegV family protein [Demequina globuliformis]
MTGPTVVVTDSAASVPTALAREFGLVVVPLSVIVDDEAFEEGVSITSDQVLAALTVGSTVTTSQPAPQAFSEAFRGIADGGAGAIVAVLIGGKLSGTVDAARAAASTVDIPVTVVDSRTVAMGTGFAALAAAKVARDGAPAGRVGEIARVVAASVTCVFTVDTLEYLRRGGRISSAAAAMGRVLSVRPVLEIVDGEASVTHKVRSTARARDTVLDRAEEAIAAATAPAVAVMTLGDGTFGDDAARSFRLHHDHLAMQVDTTISSVLAVHAGPGALAVVVADVAASSPGRID